jgi:hypothetical protein
MKLVEFLSTLDNNALLRVYDEHGYVVLDEGTVAYAKGRFIDNEREVYNVTTVTEIELK